MSLFFLYVCFVTLPFIALVRWNQMLDAYRDGKNAAAVFHAIVALIALWALYLVVAHPAHASDPRASSPEPQASRRLIVWTDPCCANCREFWADCNAGLSQELAAAGWKIERYEIRRRPLQAWAMNIAEVPCFVIPDEGRFWYGYHPGGFREAFSLASHPALSDGSPADVVTPVTQPVSQAELEQWLENQFQDQRAQLEQQLATQTSIDQARTQSLEQAIQLQQTVINELRGGDPDVDQRLDQITQTLQQMARPHPEPQPAPQAPPASMSPPAAGEAKTSETPWFMKLGRFALTAAETAGLFGLTGFSGFGAIVAVKGLWGFVRRWRGRKKPTAVTDAPAQPGPIVHRPRPQIPASRHDMDVATCEPAPRVEQPVPRPATKAATSKTHYQQVPVVDVEAEALKESMRRVASVYPESARFMELVEQSADEIERGLKLSAKQQMQPVTGGLPWND